MQPNKAFLTVSKRTYAVAHVLSNLLLVSPASVVDTALNDLARRHGKLDAINSLYPPEKFIDDPGDLISALQTALMARKLESFEGTTEDIADMAQVFCANYRSLGIRLGHEATRQAQNPVPLVKKTKDVPGVLAKWEIRLSPEKAAQLREILNPAEIHEQLTPEEAAAFGENPDRVKTVSEFVKFIDLYIATDGFEFEGTLDEFDQYLPYHARNLRQPAFERAARELPTVSEVRPGVYRIAALK